MLHRLIVIVLGFTTAAGGSLQAAPRTGSVSRCADGACVPKRNTFGYHAGGWRKWPGGKASVGGVQAGAPKPALLKELPSVELPDPQHEDVLDQPLVPPRSEEADPVVPPAEPKRSDPPPLPPIDPEDAPPGLPKAMRELDPKPKLPVSPMNELFRNTPLPVPLPGQGAGSTQGVSTAGMPLTIFRPGAKVRSDEVKPGGVSALRAAKKSPSKENDSLPGRYVSGVFMASDKLAKVSKAKKSDSRPRWTNPLRAGVGETVGGEEPAGFVAKVFAPPRRIDRVAPGIDKPTGSLPQGVQTQGDSPEPVLAKIPAAPPSVDNGNKISEPATVRSMAFSESLPNQNPLRESVRNDQYVKPVSYETPGLPRSPSDLPQRSNPLR